MDQFKAGKYKKNPFGGDYKYKSFLPTKINKPYEWEEKEIDILLEEASNKLTSLNSYALQMPDIDSFIKMHVAKEATTSSKIEGIRTEIEEVFMEKDDLVPERRDDWEEVQNYIKAMDLAIEKLEDLPLTMRLIKKVHRVLLSGVRGETKRAGEVRGSQNWIGSENIDNASFVPPHPDDLPELLGDLERFWHNDSLQLPHLIKAGISHYQFETIHPFLDGNGRIGRLLVTSYLIYVDILDKPVLYLSDFLARNRSEYFQSLVQVREKDDLDQWLKFFLEGIVDTSEKGISTLEQAVSLKEKYLEVIDKKVSSRRRELAQKALLYLFSDPLVGIDELSDVLDVTFPTASSLLDELEKAEIVTETTGKARSRRFKLVDYIKIFK